ncbi:MAG: type II toxin-antitoxin system HicB family antitoxin [Chloroflexi bacterium]|nr:type II toxin-antitoxin system HicB family antitoxin [Chloroflexota bacterium]
MLFTVILEPEPEGGYSVHCPALPGCAAQGDTIEEALANTVVAIRQALEGWEQDDLPPPTDSLEAFCDELYEILAARDEDDLPLTIETRQLEVPALKGERLQVPLPSGTEPPVVLTVPEDPRGGKVKRGALGAYIRHSGMTAEQFIDYVGQESEMLERESSE